MSCTKAAQDSECFATLLRVWSSLLSSAAVVIACSLTFALVCPSLSAWDFVSSVLCSLRFLSSFSLTRLLLSQSHSLSHPCRLSLFRHLLALSLLLSLVFSLGLSCLTLPCSLCSAFYLLPSAFLLRSALRAPFSLPLFPK